MPPLTWRHSPGDVCVGGGVFSQRAWIASIKRTIGLVTPLWHYVVGGGGTLCGRRAWRAECCCGLSFTQPPPAPSLLLLTGPPIGAMEGGGCSTAWKQHFPPHLHTIIISKENEIMSISKRKSSSLSFKEATEIDNGETVYFVSISFACLCWSVFWGGLHCIVSVCLVHNPYPQISAGSVNERLINGDHLSSCTSCSGSDIYIYRPAPGLSDRRAPSPALQYPCPIMTRDWSSDPLLRARTTCGHGVWRPSLTLIAALC